MGRDRGRSRASQARRSGVGGRNCGAAQAPRLMTVRFTPRARNDLREILEYIAKKNLTGAERVGRAILDTTALIAARPHLGIRNAKAPGLRSRLITRYPYRI